MSRYTLLFWLLLSQAARAHHTKDHLMLSEDAAQVIATTREGSGGDWVWLVWVGVTVVLLFGFVRVWHNRK